MWLARCNKWKFPSYYLENYRNAENERRAEMNFWKVMNLTVSCLLGIMVYRIASSKAREMRLFEKKDIDG